jgi:hypothetical protein
MTARELVTVKPLEWEPDGDAFEARDVFGEHYRVERDGGLGWYVNHTALINDGDLRETFAEAQADGQADFTARIIAALDLSGVEALEAENKRLAQALNVLVATYDRANPMRSADMHDAECNCLRCAVDFARAITQETPDGQ